MKREKITLKKELGLLEATLCGVGIIFGAGIYVLVGKAAGIAGNAVWISFFLAALIAAFTGLSYAELSSIFPKAGAEYIYTRKAFGKKLAFLVGWLIIIGGVIGGAAVALGFSGYVSAVFNTPIIPVAIALIFASCFIIFYGIKQSTRIAIIFTLIEASGLILIIFIGLPHIGTINYFEMPAGLAGISGAAALIFFAFIGFEEIVKLSEETKRPKKVIPKALLLAIGATTIIYILVALSCVSVLNWEKLGASNSPLADVASKAVGNDAFIILSVIALFATANTVLLVLLSTSRIIYGMAKSKCLPNILAKIHPKRRTPWVATIFVMVLSTVFALVGDIEIVAGITNFAVFVTFMIINMSVVRLRYTRPKLKRMFKTPINIGKFPVLPAFGILFCVFLLTNLSFQVLVSGTVLLITGLLVYKGMEKIDVL